MSRRLIPRSLLNLDPTEPVGRCFVLRRAKDRAIRIGWTEDLRSRLAKIESQHPGENILLASFPARKDTYRELLLIVAPYKIRNRWHRDCPEMSNLIAGIRFARSTSHVYEDHLDKEVLRTSEALELLAKHQVDERHLRTWARPGQDVYETAGGHTRWCVQFIDQLRIKFSGMDSPASEFEGVTFSGVSHP